MSRKSSKQRAIDEAELREWAWAYRAPKPIKIVDAVGGIVRTVAEHGRYAVVGMGQRVLILDAANPRRPRWVGASEGLAWPIEELVVNGDLALVQTEFDVQVLDLSKLRWPQIVAQLGAWEAGGGVALEGTTGYAVGSLIGKDVHVFDLSIPSRPAITSQFDLPDFVAGVRRSQTGRITLMPSVEGIRVAGSRAYLATTAGLAIFDVVNRSRPSYLGSLDLGASCSTVTVAETLAYLGGEHGLHVVDVSYPGRPRQLGRFRSDTWLRQIVLDGQVGYGVDLERVLVFDLSDPARPKVLSYRSRFDSPPRDLAKFGNCLYVAGRSDGLRILDVSDPTDRSRCPAISASPTRAALRSPTATSTSSTAGAGPGEQSGARSMPYRPGVTPEECGCSGAARAGQEPAGAGPSFPEGERS